jgi:hypothetical protein
MEYFEIILPHNERVCDVQQEVSYHMPLLSHQWKLSVKCCLLFEKTVKPPLRLSLGSSGFEH